MGDESYKTAGSLEETKGLLITNVALRPMECATIPYESYRKNSMCLDKKEEVYSDSIGSHTHT